jgi:hypothetical protein
MIMPSVFGAFGNFLLPTQLGVHDVAFPRLNSAAFWFLPGGLIMLCQLVCVDRRYQRMNCFNIRELQGILKRKFFTDLVNSNDHRTLLDQSVIGLRFKNNANLGLMHDMPMFYNFGTTTSPKTKDVAFTNNYFSDMGLATSYFSFNNLFSLNFLNTFIDTCLQFISNIFLSLPTTFASIISPLYSFSSITTFLTNNVN